MSKRDENTILAEKIAAMQAYAEARKNPQSTQAEIEEKGQSVKDLSRELDAVISDGAKPCPNCLTREKQKARESGEDSVLTEQDFLDRAGRPMGMLKTPAYSANGTDYPNVWEVGCVICPPFLQEREDGTALVVEGKPVKVKRRSYSARGFSAAEAVAKWNCGQWVEDFRFELMRGFTPVEPGAQV